MALRFVDLARDIPGLRGTRIHILPMSFGSRLAAVLAGHGFRIYALDGARIEDEPSFMKEVAQALALPDYFRHNWEALNDSLGELEERPERNVAVVWRDAARCLSTDPQTLLNAALAFDWAGSYGLRDTQEDPIQLEVFLLV
jgi:RNAse (barnase) inhibitor barstar